MKKTQTNTELSSYELAANEFALKHGIKLTFGSPSYGSHFDDDKQSRYIFPCKLSCNGKSYSFKFGQSIAAGDERPSMYDVLACMTKYDPGTFENFCSEYGYDTDSRKAEKTYKAVCKEFAAMERLFSPEVLNEMQDIN